MSELDKAQPEANLISASTSTIFLRLGLGLADGSSDYLGLLLNASYQLEIFPPRSCE